MAVVSDTFTTRWRSGKHVGRNRPVHLVEIQLGAFHRTFREFVSLGGAEPPNVVIPGTNRWKPYQGHWDPSTEWLTLDNINEINLEQDFQQNGLTVATIHMDSLAYQPEAGIGGFIFHRISRGHYAPLRGYTPPGQPRTQQELTGWFQLLNRKARIRIWQGYGDDELVITFQGLIDDLDLTSKPDTIEITARDFGQCLTDQKLYGANKDPHIKDPVFFADRRTADETKPVGGVSDASSTEPYYPARFAVDLEKTTYWKCRRRSVAANTEWIQVKVPEGRYDSIKLHSRWAGLVAYVGVYAKPYGRGDRKTGGVAVLNPKLDGERVDPGWIDVPQGGIVPGTTPGGDEDGGWTYMKKVPRTVAKEVEINLGHEVYLGPDSIIRVGFRNLHRVKAGDYRCAVTYLAGLKRKTKKQAKTSAWILVDDVSEIVKLMLMWAGFPEWEVESTGASIGGDEGVQVFNRNDSYMDVINWAVEKTGYVFSMADPTNAEDDVDGESLGVPIFRKNQALVDLDNVTLIRDSDMLTGINMRITEEPLRWVIRVRGKEVTKGGLLATDPETYVRVRRNEVYYRPPWFHRMARVLKHETVTRHDISKYEDLWSCAYLIAFLQALESTTAVIEIPGNPAFELDGQVRIVDHGVGLNSRLWIARRSSQFKAGKAGSWKTTLGGSLIDTPDITEMKAALADLDPDSTWLPK